MQGNMSKLYNKCWFQHIPKLIATCSDGTVTMLWNQQVQTNITIPNNKPDIIICDNKKEHTSIW